MTDASNKGKLLSELEAKLPDLRTRYRVSLTPVFADLIWDLNMDPGEFFNLDPAVVVNASDCGRQIALQRVRDEIRYYLTCNNDPTSPSPETELGVSSTIDDAVKLCDEFLSRKVPQGELQTPRRAGEGLLRRGK